MNPLFLLPLLCAPLRAGTFPEVAIVGLHIPDLSSEQTLELNVRLAQALATTGRVEVISPQEVGRRIRGREDLVLAGMYQNPGRKLIEEGRLLYDRAEPDQAIPRLEEAVETLEAGMESTTDGRSLVEAYMLLGIAQAALGENESASASFGQVLRLDPGREMDRVNFPPSFVEIFDQVRTDLSQQGPSTIDVEATRPGSSVYLDGRRVGIAPISIPDVYPGGHHLLVIAPEGFRTYEQVDLAPDDTFTMEAILDQRIIARADESPEDQSQQTRELYRSLGEHIQTDLILIGGSTNANQVGVQLYATRSGSFSKVLSASVEGGDPADAILDLVPTLAGFATSTGDLRSDRVSPQTLSLDIETNTVISDLLLNPQTEVEIQVVKERVGPRWYVWTGGALVAAGGAAGVVYLSTRETVGNDGTIVFGPIPE